MRFIHLVIVRYLFLVIVSELADSAKILFFFGLSTYSHRISVWPLAERLADRGDEVTFYQPIRPKKTHPKIRDFVPFESSVQENTPGNSFLNIRLTQGTFGAVSIANSLRFKGLGYCDQFLSSPETAQFMKNAKFDLIIIDALFNECAYGLAFKLGSKIAVYSTSTFMPWWNDAFGIPTETSWIPDINISFQFPLNFGERLIATIGPLVAYYSKNWLCYPALEELLRKKLDIPNMPSIAELERNTSLVLMNTHFSEEFARSIPPLVIPVGGMHCGNATGKLVPKDIVDFIRGAGDTGFIYVSFGSEVRISDAPESLRNIFYTAIGNTKARFVWKWDGPRPTEMPPNVLTAEWVPQQDILALKPKAFITHGGLLSVQEAITYAIPMIAVPVFAEQDYNAYRLERTGRGIKLEVSTLTLAELERAISDILINQTYKDNMIKASRLFKDRPRPPVDEALWWIDYVLRNEDVNHLKPLAMEQFWFQRRLLDVWLFLGFVLLAVIYLIIFIFKSIFNLLINFVSTKPSLKSSASKRQKIKKS